MQSDEGSSKLFATARALVVFIVAEIIPKLPIDMKLFFDCFWNVQVYLRILKEINFD